MNGSHGDYGKRIVFILYPSKGNTVEATKTSGGWGGRRSFRFKIALWILIFLVISMYAHSVRSNVSLYIRPIVSRQTFRHFIFIVYFVVFVNIGYA